MDFENILLSGISQLWKDKYCAIPRLCEVAGVVKFIETVHKLVGGGVWGCWEIIV